MAEKLNRIMTQAALLFAIAGCQADTAPFSISRTPGSTPAETPTAEYNSNIVAVPLGGRATFRNELNGKTVIIENKRPKGIFATVDNVRLQLDSDAFSDCQASCLFFDETMDQALQDITIEVRIGDDTNNKSMMLYLRGLGDWQRVPAPTPTPVR